MVDVVQMICNYGLWLDSACSTWQAVGACSPQVPDAYFAIMASRQYALWLLVCTHLANHHQQKVCGVAGGVDSPQVPDTYFAVIASRNYAVLLLVRKVNVSDRHQVSIWDVCHLLQASHIPHLEWAVVAVGNSNATEHTVKRHCDVQTWAVIAIQQCRLTQA